MTRRLAFDPDTEETVQEGGTASGYAAAGGGPNMPYDPNARYLPDTGEPGMYYTPDREMTVGIGYEDDEEERTSMRIAATVEAGGATFEWSQDGDEVSISKDGEELDYETLSGDQEPEDLARELAQAWVNDGGLNGSVEPRPRESRRRALNDADALIPGVDYEPSVCPICGRDEHTSEELAECMSHVFGDPEERDASRHALNDAGGGGSTPDDDADTGLGDAFDEGDELYSVQPESSGPLIDNRTGEEMVNEPEYNYVGRGPFGGSSGGMDMLDDIMNSTREQVASRQGANGPQGHWCMYCGDYQSTRNPAEIKKMRAHQKQHEDAGDERLPVKGGFPTKSMRKGAPFADYSDFADCVSKNSDKDDPDAYCGYIKHKVEDKKSKLGYTVEGAEVCKACYEGDHEDCTGYPCMCIDMSHDNDNWVDPYSPTDDWAHSARTSAKYRGDLDRSVAFTILLDVMPGYADSPDDGGKTVTAFLEDWYEDPGTDMYAFAKQWVQGRTARRRLSRKDLAMANRELARFAARTAESKPMESYPHVILRVTGGARSLEEVQAYLYSNWHAQQIEDGTIFITGYDMGGFGMNALRERLMSGLIATEIVGHTGSDTQEAIHPPGQGVTWASKHRALFEIPIGEVCRGDVLVPPNGLVDVRRNRVASVEGFSGMWIINFANGTATSPLANGNVTVVRPVRKRAAGPRSAVAGEGAYVTDQYDSGIREEVAAGTVAHGRLVGMTMFGESYAWTVEGVSGDMWSLGGNWSETTTASRRADSQTKTCGRCGENVSKNADRCPHCGAVMSGQQDPRAARKTARALHEIADEIVKDWRNPYFGAVPYIDALRYLDSINDNYGADDARGIVAYFLSNASGWRGETAKRVKAELKAMLSGKGAVKTASNYYLDMIEDSDGNLVDIEYYHNFCAPPEVKEKGGWPAPDWPDYDVYCAGCGELIHAGIESEARRRGGVRLANEDEDSAYTVRDPRNPRGLYGGERNILLQDRALELHDNEERRQLEMRELEHRAPKPTKGAARSDYAHWNEDQDYMWYQEEGRFPEEPPEYDEYDDAHAREMDPEWEVGDTAWCEHCGDEITWTINDEWADTTHNEHCDFGPGGHHAPQEEGNYPSWQWEADQERKQMGITGARRPFVREGGILSDILNFGNPDKWGPVHCEPGQAIEDCPTVEEWEKEHGKESARTAMPAPADLGVNVGDIFYCSWGYDQTNINFYKVIRLTGQGVEIVPIGSRAVEMNGPGGNRVVAAPEFVRDWDVLIGTERGGKQSKVCRLKSGYQGRPAIVLKSGEYSAYLWDGRPLYETDSMYGH